MEEINDVLYESKLIGYPKPFKNKVRTFCQNPGGVVSQENYDNDLAVVNGHAFKGADLKSPNTNVAILCSHNFSVPFNQPIAYAQKVGELTNMLANGHILVQRFGDILDGKRTWEKELALLQRPSHPGGRRRGRHHRRHALPRDDKHHQLHPVHGRSRPRLRQPTRRCSTPRS